MRIIVDKRPTKPYECILKRDMFALQNKKVSPVIKYIDVLCSEDCKNCPYITTLEELK